MGKVLPFKRREDARVRKQKDDGIAAQPHEEGSIRFVVNSRGDTDMHVTGVFERRLQFALYTVIKASARLADKIAESGMAGHFRAGPIHEPLLQAPPPRGLPRRRRQSTGLGDLE